MKAIYMASPRSKKGNIFHIYNVVGTVAEIEEYKNSPNFKQYPAIGPNGEIQFITNYIGMEDEMNLVKKKDGNFTLDTGSFNKDIARLNAVAEASAVLADKFADRIADKLSGSASASVTKKTFKTVEETVEDSTDNLDSM
jgi:hypothetical protein